MARFNTVLYVLAESLRGIGILLAPLVPTSSHLLLDLMGVPAPLRTFASIPTHRIEPGTSILEPRGIFPRIDTSAVSATTATAPTAITVSTAVADAPIVGFEETLSVAEIESQIVIVGGKIRDLKAAKASKGDLKLLVDELLFLKER